MVGASAVSAIGSVTLISNMFMAFCIGAATASGVIVSQYHGTGNFQKSTLASRAWLIVTSAMALVVTVFALVLSDPLLHLLNTPKSILADASIYMKIYLGGTLSAALYYTPFSILRGLDDAKIPLIFLIACSVLNIVLDLLFAGPLGMKVADATWDFYPDSSLH